MFDKILTEAFDKLKAIEESEVDEAYSIDNGEQQYRAPYKTYSISNESGDDYVMHIQSNPRGGEDEVFFEANGISIAHFILGGAGAMNASIQKPEELMNMLAAAMMAADGSGR